MDKDIEKAKRARHLAFLEAPYMPNTQTGPTPDFRVANALEYIAYQLYDIRQSARKLADRQNPAAPEGE